MRLNAIKLAGFKSFVDPMTLRVTTNLTGVVGPNGCGKSNVIDAVRWVIGESSAKQLRGESLEDVIFTGSKSRKPVGRASVELIFDNSEGRFGDRYSEFGEIAVKREVTRDGGSNYFLNGSRCRRRDIIDLFLGTGLGGKNNYAIIEQGTVSRFIEARPEDFRLILEEAAGISKYRERRRETENRIKHTRENLDRINDLRGELNQRLEVLKRQADNAEKFKEFKKKERILRAELLALRWLALESEAQTLQGTKQQAEAQLAERQELVRVVSQQREEQRRQQQAASQKTQDAQAEYYAAEAEVSRVEQAIRHAEELLAGRKREVENLDAQVQDTESRIAAERQRKAELESDCNKLIDDHNAAEEEENRVRARVTAADHDAQAGLEAWERFTQESQEPLKQAEGEKARVEQLEQSIARLAQRVEKSREELQQLRLEPLRTGVAEAIAALSDMDKQLGGVTGLLENSDRSLQELRQRRTELESALHEAREALQGSRGRLASLEAMQQAALREDDEALAGWAGSQGLDADARLARGLQVESGWEAAVETALGPFLQAVNIDSLDRLSVQSQWPELDIVLVETSGSPGNAGPAPANAVPLADKITNSAPAASLLSNLFAVDSEADALARRSQLKPGQAFVTRAGLMVGSNWLMHPRRGADEQGVLGREQAIKTLRTEADAHASRSESLGKELAELTQRLSVAEAERKTHTQQADQLRRRHGELLADKQSREVRLEQTQNRAEKLGAEIAELEASLSARQEELNAAQQRLKQMLEDAANIAKRRSALQEELRGLRESLSEVREAREQIAVKRQNLQVEVTARRSALESVAQTLNELERRLEQMRARRVEIGTALAGQTQGPDPIAQQREARNAAAEKQTQAKAALQAARESLKQIENSADDLARRAHEAERALEGIREQAQQARLDFQTIDVRRQTLNEQIAESGNSLEALRENLSEEANVAGWESELEATERRIQRLGAINLAAIEEYEEHQKREAYLGEQHQDLTDALTTLEEAIHKIDKETRARFKETFDKIDTMFRDIFPKLFGGGEAHLELTGDDLLDTGVRVIARPPGKRNSTIQLLSGGEKAMTAVALLFALFKLNPAPFCMLDEVDAPLDDANVSRFCELVRQMSEEVQFIIITHNKLTMELVHQLHGVTMQEPGVSRLVSVDVDKAVEMAHA